MVERGLVGCGGGEGFELERDGLEAGAQKGGAEAEDGEGFVLFGFGSDEADGAADGGVADGRAELVLGADAELGEDAGDEVFEGVGAAEDLGAGEGFYGQVGFERLDETAGAVVIFVRFEVALDGRGAGAGEDAVFRLFEIKDGAGTEGIVGETDEFVARATELLVVPQSMPTRAGEACAARDMKAYYPSFWGSG